MKQWVITGLLAVMMLSGCFGDAEGSDPDAADPDDSGDAMDDGSMDDGSTDDGNETGDGDNATADGNTVPVIDPFEANQTEGEVPFDVRFDFNASDADGDDLNWTLDADGDGTVDSEGTGAVLPFNFTFTFDTAGTYNATLNVTDGTNSTSAVVTITATEPEEEPPEEEGGEEAPVREDRGWYEYEPSTGLCYVKAYEDVGGVGVLYSSALSGGNWYIAESNDVPGLQIANNHPGAAAGSTGGFALDVPECQDGDQVVV